MLETALVATITTETHNSQTGESSSKLHTPLSDVSLPPSRIS
jgi:hypothetical protein